MFLIKYLLFQVFFIKQMIFHDVQIQNNEKEFVFESRFDPKYMIYSVYQRFYQCQIFDAIEEFSRRISLLNVIFELNSKVNEWKELEEFYIPNSNQLKHEEILMLIEKFYQTSNWCCVQFRYISNNMLHLKTLKENRKFELDQCTSIPFSRMIIFERGRFKLFHYNLITIIAVTVRVYTFKTFQALEDVYLNSNKFNFFVKNLYVHMYKYNEDVKIKPTLSIPDSFAIFLRRIFTDDKIWNNYNSSLSVDFEMETEEEKEKEKGQTENKLFSNWYGIVSKAVGGSDNDFTLHISNESNIDLPYLNDSSQSAIIFSIIEKYRSLPLSKDKYGSLKNLDGTYRSVLNTILQLYLTYGVNDKLELSFYEMLHLKLLFLLVQPLFLSKKCWNHRQNQVYYGGGIVSSLFKSFISSDPKLLQDIDTLFEEMKSNLSSYSTPSEKVKGQSKYTTKKYTKIVYQNITKIYKPETNNPFTTVQPQLTTINVITTQQMYESIDVKMKTKDQFSQTQTLDETTLDETTVIENLTSNSSTKFYKGLSILIGLTLIMLIAASNYKSTMNATTMPKATTDNIQNLMDGLKNEKLISIILVIILFVLVVLYCKFIKASRKNTVDKASRNGTVNKTSLKNIVSKTSHSYTVSKTSHDNTASKTSQKNTEKRVNTNVPVKINIASSKKTINKVSTKEKNNPSKLTKNLKSK